GGVDGGRPETSWMSPARPVSSSSAGSGDVRRHTAWRFDASPGWALCLARLCETTHVGRRVQASSATHRPTRLLRGAPFDGRGWWRRFLPPGLFFSVLGALRGTVLAQRLETHPPAGHGRRPVASLTSPVFCAR